MIYWLYLTKGSIYRFTFFVVRTSQILYDDEHNMFSFLSESHKRTDTYWYLCFGLVWTMEVLFTGHLGKHGKLKTWYPYAIDKILRETGRTRTIQGSLWKGRIVTPHCMGWGKTNELSKGNLIFGFPTLWRVTGIIDPVGHKETLYVSTWTFRPLSTETCRPRDSTHPFNTSRSELLLDVFIFGGERDNGITREHVLFHSRWPILTHFLVLLVTLTCSLSRFLCILPIKTTT